MILIKNSVRTIILIFVFAAAAGCSAIIAGATSSMADSLSDAIINQSDPETVRQGAPAFLLMMDGFVGNSPKSGSLLQGAAKLYAVYGAVFVDDPGTEVPCSSTRAVFLPRQSRLQQDPSSSSPRIIRSMSERLREAERGSSRGS